MADFGGLLLKIALDAVGLVPGMSEAKSVLTIASDVEPALVTAIEGTKAFLGTAQGQKAIHDLGAALGAHGVVAHDPDSGTITITSDALKPDTNTPSDPSFYGN